MQLEDGKGTGHQAAVDKENRLQVFSVTLSKFASTSETHGSSFCWTSATAALAANDTLLWLTSSSTTQILHIQKIYVWGDVPTVFKVHCPTYTAPAGTLVTGVNLNRTSGLSAETVAYTDETTNVFAQTNVITTVRNNEATADEFGQWINYDGALILGYHNCVAIDTTIELAAFQCTIMGYFHD